MPSYYDLLKHPNWQKRRLEVFALANFTCGQCGSKENTLHVHHCYYEKGKKPWEYPHSALRCLCEHCHKSAEDLRLSTSKLLSETHIDDEVYGYTLGGYAFHEQDMLVSVDSYEIASGFADYWGIDLEKHLLPHLLAHDSETCGRGMLELVARFGAPSKPWLERYARRKQEA